MINNSNTINFNLIINIDAIINKFKKYNNSEKKTTKIIEAYQIVNKYHENQFRKSKEPYIQHLLETANILVDLKASAEMIIVALMHDVLEDTTLKEEIIVERFGTKIKDAIVALTKVKNITKQRNENEKINYDYTQQLIVGMLGDPNIIIVKLADRLHNMRTLSFLSEEKRQRIATETLEVFVPLSHKLAIHKFKAELEDLCFLHLFPKENYQIQELVENDTIRNSHLLIQMQEQLEKLFENEKFEINKIYGRKKHYYSIYKKMEHEGKNFSEILDFLAIRVITKNKSDCYKALGLIHDKYRPIPTRLKDYISMPKENLYKALHTTIIFNKTTLEIQIRDEEMEETANYGIASHYLYKSNSKKELKDLAFFKYIKKYTEQYENVSTKRNKIVQDTMYDFFGNDVPVLTPKGDIVNMPKGSSALDFAFKLHTDLGVKASNAIINGVVSPLSSILKSGDLISIDINEALELRPESLNWVYTKYAQNHIKKYLNKNNKIDIEIEENFAKQIINDFLIDYPEYSIILIDKNYPKIINNLNLKNMGELWKGIINKKISIIDLLNAFFKTTDDLEKINKQKIIKKSLKKSNKIEEWTKDLELDIPMNKVKKIDKCYSCRPIFGDATKAELRKNIFTSGIAEEIRIHRKNCDLLKKVKPTHQIDVNWKQNHPSGKKYETTFKFIIPNRPGILVEVFELFIRLKINIIESKTITLYDKSLASMELTFKVYNIKELSSLFTFLKQKHEIIYDIIRK